MKKYFLLIISTAFIISCSNPLSQVYNEESFMLDMAEIRKYEGDDAVKSITSYVLQESMRDALKDDDKKENNLVGRSYKELLFEGDKLAEELKRKEEEEKKLAEEQKRKRKALALQISESLTFAMTKKGYSKGEYGFFEKITYRFVFKNKTQKDIAGVKGSITFYDIFDEKISSISLKYDEGIKAGQTKTYNAQTDYNSFESEDVKLKNTSLDKLKVIWEPEQLIFSDGEKLTLD